MSSRTNFRSRPEMLTTVLETIISQRGEELRWTRVMSACRTNYRQIMGYRRIMEEKGLIRIEGDDVQVTQKGFEFLAVSRKFFGLLENEGEPRQRSLEAGH